MFYCRRCGRKVENSDRLYFFLRTTGYCEKCAHEILQEHSRKPGKKYYCMRCGNITRESDYLPENYSLYVKLYRIGLCEDCLRKLGEEGYIRWMGGENI